MPWYRKDFQSMTCWNLLSKKEVISIGHQVFHIEHQRAKTFESKFFKEASSSEEDLHSLRSLGTPLTACITSVHGSMSSQPKQDKQKPPQSYQIVVRTSCLYHGCCIEMVDPLQLHNLMFANLIRMQEFLVIALFSFALECKICQSKIPRTAPTIASLYFLCRSSMSCWIAGG
eukprot:2716093-Amphidinium_carterae.1